ncbi:MAG: hypothetical protein ACXWNR_03045, partial [Candidatus Limnocylindrales bacterium]
MVLERRSFDQVEGLALWQTLDNIHQIDIGYARFGDPLRGRRADVAGADDSYFASTDWHVLTSLVRNAGGGSRRGGINALGGPGCSSATARIVPRTRRVSSTDAYLFRQALRPATCAYQAAAIATFNCSSRAESAAG